MIARIEAQDAPYRCSRCGFVIPPDTSIVVLVWNELQFHYCPACVKNASEVKTS